MATPNFVLKYNCAAKYILRKIAAGVKIGRPYSMETAYLHLNWAQNCSWKGSLWRKIEVGFVRKKRLQSFAPAEIWISPNEALRMQERKKKKTLEVVKLRESSKNRSLR